MIKQETRGKAGYIILARAEKRNALNIEMVRSIIEAVHTFTRDPEVTCIVIKAEGPVFCAGADLKELGGSGKKGINLYADVVESLLGSAKPSIVLVQGPVVGGGVGIVASCHLAVGTDEATFITPEIKSDLFPLMVYTLISGRAGRKLAMEMALCQKTLKAQEAVAAGLLNAVVPRERLEETAEQWVKTICQWDDEVVERGLGTIHEIYVKDLIDKVRTCQKAIDSLDQRRQLKARP